MLLKVKQKKEALDINVLSRFKSIFNAKANTILNEIERSIKELESTKATRRNVKIWIIK